MTELGMYSIYDVKALAFKNPFFLVNDQVAIRIFGDIVQDKTSDVSKHPEDYSLYKLSVVNVRTGAVTSTEKREIMQGKQLLNIAE